MPECVPIIVKASSVSVVVPDLCHWELDPGAINWDGSAVPAGATVCLNAGNYTRLRLTNLVGTALNPITIVNYGGLVTIQDGGLDNYLVDCQHIHLTGNGTGALKYGIKFERRLLAVAGCTDMEFSHMEFDGAALHVRNDDDITMENIYIHHNYSHDENEPYYIGKSLYTGDGAETLQNVYIYRNRVIHCGDGIQCSRVTSNCYVYDNYLENQDEDKSANRGLIVIRHGCQSRVFRNECRDAENNGISVDDDYIEDHEIYNNLTYNVGHTPSAGYKADAIRGSSENIKAYNNTIATVGDGSDGWGIWFPNTSSNNEAYNNVVLDCTDGSIRQGGSPGGNFHHNDTQEEGHTLANYNFENQPTDFHLTSSSPGVDAGTNTDAPADDLDHKARPVDGTTDIGCYEFGCP